MRVAVSTLDTPSRKIRFDTVEVEYQVKYISPVKSMPVVYRAQYHCREGGPFFIYFLSVSNPSPTAAPQVSSIGAIIDIMQRGGGDNR